MDNYFINNFAKKIAQALKEIASSHVLFIMQQAFGDISWEEAVEILDNVLCATKEKGVK